VKTSDDLRTLPLIVLRNLVPLPGEEVAIELTRPESVATAERLASGDACALAVQDEAWREEVPALDEGMDALLGVAVTARVEASERKNGASVLRVTVLGRAELDGVAANDAGPRRSAVVRPIAARGDEALLARLGGLVGDQRDALSDAARALLDASGDAGVDAGAALDAVAPTFAADASERRALLLESDPARRLALLAPWIERRRAWAATVGGFEVLPPDQLDEVWVLRDDGPARIEAKLAAGEITEREADELRQYREKGFVLWPGLIDEAEIDALVRDVRSIGEHPGRFVTTDHRRGAFYRFSGPDFDAYESIFDTYVNFASARRVSYHPRILRFLELLFEEPPVAMQQLLFQRSNQHKMHQDTAYVRVQEPLRMAATWIALEDVVEGRGELAYYEGSHRIPHQVFSTGGKWFDLEHDDEDASVRHVVEESERLGCTKHGFLAKKGDVFLWAADLVHGSAPRTRPDEETRLSCVTHYSPLSAKPLWFLFTPDRCGLAPYGERAFVASSHYALADGAPLPDLASGDAPLAPGLKHPLPS